MSANALEMSEAAGAILDDLDDTVDTFGNGVGHSGFDEGKDASLVTACCGDEPAQWFEAAAQGRGSPALEESHCGPRVS